jgi:hypothetical protein
LAQLRNASTHVEGAWKEFRVVASAKVLQYLRLRREGRPRSRSGIKLHTLFFLNGFGGVNSIHTTMTILSFPFSMVSLRWL